MNQTWISRSPKDSLIDTHTHQHQLYPDGEGDVQSATCMHSKHLSVRIIHDNKRDDPEIGVDCKIRPSNEFLCSPHTG